MTAQERAIEFVNRYPSMFNTDKEFWIDALELEFLRCEKDQVLADIKTISEKKV
jgi:hypothetical protein